MRRQQSLRQRGVALIALLAVLAIGASAYLIRQLNVESGAMDAIRKNRNAEVLNRAKQALIGYVAIQAAKAGERNPGRLPCPEGASYVGDASNEGTAWGGFGTDCASVGRLPWRTLGLDKLVDAEAEPLWYVVGPAWRLTSSGTLLTINSNTPGDTTIGGEQVVALIVAPGKAMNVQACAGQPARNQARAAPAPTMDARDYLECFDAATLQFVTGPANSYNDQVVRITLADVMPAIEAAIAHRIEREIVPLLSSVYVAPNWGLGGSDRVYPFAVPFSNPATSSFTGTSTAPPQGFLPVVYSEIQPVTTMPSTLCTAGVAAPRCDPSIAGWTNWASSLPSMSYTGTGVTLTSTCSYFGQRDWAYCNGSYLGTPTTLTISGRQTGTTALRAIKSPLPTGFVFWLDLTSFSFTLSQPTPTFQIQSDGALAVRISIAPPAPVGIAGVMYWLYVPGDVTADHSLLDSRTASSTGWFLRNEWHKVLYYGVAPGYLAASAAPRACSDSGVITCLQVTNLIDPAKHRVILALTGRRLAGQARPGASFADYLDGTENQNGDSIFVKSPVNATFNDRFISVSKNP